MYIPLLLTIFYLPLILAKKFDSAVQQPWVAQPSTEILPRVQKNPVSDHLALIRAFISSFTFNRSVCLPLSASVPASVVQLYHKTDLWMQNNNKQYFPTQYMVVCF